MLKICSKCGKKFDTRYIDVCVCCECREKVENPQDEIARLKAENERFEFEIADLIKKNEELLGMICDECNGDGWKSNAVEGRHPCVCVEEMEAYQMLKAENANLKEELAEQECARVELETRILRLQRGK